MQFWMQFPPFNKCDGVIRDGCSNMGINIQSANDYSLLFICQKKKIAAKTAYDVVKRDIGK